MAVRGTAIAHVTTRHSITRRRAGRPRREETGELTKQILAAGLEEFRIKGYAAASIEAIAGSARVSRNALYRRFAGKQSLFRAVLFAQIAGLRDKIDALIDGGGDPLLALKRTIWADLQLSLDPVALDLTRIVVAEAAEFADLAAEMTSPLAAGLGEQLGVLVARAQDAGLLRPGPAEQWRDVLGRLVVDGPRWQALGGKRWDEAALSEDFETMWAMFLTIARRQPAGSSLPAPSMRTSDLPEYVDCRAPHPGGL